MTKTRIEAFSDGVIAIIITIMVLEMKVPHHSDWQAFKPLVPVFMSYILSFVMVGIYWGNHHHLLHTIQHINGKVMWANLHLLFWLSLIPFATGWMGENNFDTTTVVVYAALSDLCGIAYFILLKIVVNSHSHNAALALPLQYQTRKGLLSTIAYTAAIPLGFVNPAISGIIFAAVAVMWLLPDRNIERSMENES